MVLEADVFDRRVNIGRAQGPWAVHLAEVDAPARGHDLGLRGLDPEGEALDADVQTVDDLNLLGVAHGDDALGHLRKLRQLGRERAERRSGHQVQLAAAQKAQRKLEAKAAAAEEKLRSREAAERAGGGPSLRSMPSGFDDDSLKRVGSIDITLIRSCTARSTITDTRWASVAR